MVLTTTVPSIVSVHQWMLGPAPSRCRRSSSTYAVVQDDTLRGLQAGAQIAEFWPEYVSQRFPSRLAWANFVAHSVVLRSVAGIVAAWLDSDARDETICPFTGRHERLVVLTTPIPLTSSAQHQSLVLMCTCG